MATKSIEPIANIVIPTTAQIPDLALLKIATSRRGNVLREVRPVRRFPLSIRPRADTHDRRGGQNCHIDSHGLASRTNSLSR